MKNLYIHKEGDIDFEKIDVNQDTRIGDIIKNHLPQFAGADDYMEDLEGYLEDDRKQLSKDSSIKSLKLGNNDHLHFSRCSKIKLTVYYEGECITLDNLAPSFRLSKVKRKVAKKSGVEFEDIKPYKFKLNEESDFLDNSTHIGSLTTYPNCEIELYLVKPVLIQGFIQPDQSAFDKHIKSARFESGIDEGKWGIVQSDEHKWPEKLIWIKNRNSKLYLKFNLDKYPKVAPTAILWDKEKNLKLEQKFRPTSKDSNVTLATRMTYGKGFDSLYIPCDRMAMICHPDWEIKYPDIWWRPDDEIYKYLNFLFDLLNN